MKSNYHREKNEVLIQIARGAIFTLKHIGEATECIGLDKVHVDGNCTRCLAIMTAAGLETTVALADSEAHKVLDVGVDFLEKELLEIMGRGNESPQWRASTVINEFDDYKGTLIVWRKAERNGGKEL